MLSREYITDKTLKSKPFCIGIAVLAILLGVVFIIFQTDNTLIDRNQAVSYSGEFESYESYKNYCYINFKNGESFSVYPHTTTNEFEDKMNSLKQGTKLYILVNPNNDYVIEVKTPNEEILNFNNSQKAIASYEKGYIILGICICTLGGILLIYTFFEILNKRKSVKETNQKRAVMLSSSHDSVPIYQANPNKKCRILLQTQYKNTLLIIYQRRFFTNELVINQKVYDKKWAILEFSHSLFAKVDGNIIEVGLNENSNSYISINNKIVKRKKRKF